MLKCLSCRQPYAAEIVTGRKPEEFRSWTVAHRGPVAIHAGVSREAIAEEGLDEAAFSLGAIVGVAWLVGVTGESGDFAWQFRQPVKLREPIPMRGRVSLFALPAEIERQVRSAVEAVSPGWFGAGD